MNALGRFLSTVTGILCRILEIGLIVSVAVLVFAVLWGVFTRYVMNSPSSWTEEVATYLLMWVSMLGIAVAFDRRAHLGLDYLVNKLDPQAQRVNGVIVLVIVIVFAALVMAFGGYVLVQETLAADQRTAALDLPMGWVYSAIPISGVFIILFALEQIVELITGSDPRTRSDEKAIKAAPADPLPQPGITRPNEEG